MARPRFAIALLSSSYARAHLIRATRDAKLSKIQWLRKAGATLKSVGMTQHSLHNAVACFPSYRTQELLVIGGDGTVVRAETRR